MIFKGVAAVVLFCAIPVAAAADSDAAIAIVLILFLIAIIVLLIGNSPLRIVKHRRGEFWIKGCSWEFLNSVAEAYDR